MDTLRAGQRLNIGERIVSSDGNYFLLMQGDGNLVLFDNNNRDYWATNVVGKYATMQGDGNFVVFNQDDIPVWATNIAGHSDPYLILQNDRNLVVYQNGNSPIWASNTTKDTLSNGQRLNIGEKMVSTDGNYYLLMQGDGNLVLFDNNNRDFWATNVVGNYATMQGDGNFVVYDHLNNPVWASNTNGHPNSHLILQNDRNLVIYQNGNIPIWASNTPKETIVSPWAILMVKFKDDLSPLPNINLYKDLFTSVGNGKMNMVDFFKDMSHGKLDINSSQLFGWYTLDQNRADYIGNVGPQNGKINRDGLFNVSKSKASAAGVNLNNFAGIVVSVLGTADLFGYIGGMGAVCDSNSLQPSLLGQEMGHGYGLDHARIQGFEIDYQDPWDIMSTVSNAFLASNSDFTNVGPGLNSWNMRSRGWLDESLVWKNSNVNFNNIVTLRPLHRVDLSGYLSAEIGEFLVEFRVNERWDSAIPRSCVLIHRFANNHSYLMPPVGASLREAVDANGNKYVIATPSADLVTGDKFVSPDNKVQVDVISIDSINRTADIRFIKRSLIAKIELRTGFSDPNHFDPTPKYLDIRGLNFHINSRVKIDCNINFGVGQNGFYSVQGNSNQNGEIFINVPATLYDLAHYSRINVRVTDLADNTFVDAQKDR